MKPKTVEYQKHHIFLNLPFNPWKGEYEWSIFNQDGEEVLFGAGTDADQILSSAKAFIDTHAS